VHSELYHGLHPVEVGIHPYWGVDYMKLPAPYAHLNDRFDWEGIRYGRQLDLHGYVKRSRHFWAGCWLVVIVLAYVLLVAYSLLLGGRRSTHRVAKPTDEPGS
jgi:hypothetical protein